MIDPETIIALLAGGAIAGLHKLGGDVVSDAYGALKKILADTFEFRAADLLEKSPDDQNIRELATRSFPDEATLNPEVERSARVLQAALAAISQAKWSDAGVVFDGLTALHHIQFGNVSGGTRGVTIRNILSKKGDIRIGDVKG
jgi:hypothetical protein